MATIKRQITLQKQTSYLKKDVVEIYKIRKTNLVETRNKIRKINLESYEYCKITVTVRVRARVGVISKLGVGLGLGLRLVSGL